MTKDIENRVADLERRLDDIAPIRLGPQPETKEQKEAREKAFDSIIREPRENLRKDTVPVDRSTSATRIIQSPE